MSDRQRFTLHTNDGGGGTPNGIRELEPADRPADYLKPGNVVHLLMREKRLHGRVVRREDRDVIVRDENGNEHKVDYTSDRIWICHCEPTRRPPLR